MTVKPVPIGVRGEAEETVEFKHTLSSHHPELPPVYSTPDMIRLMETAAFRALQPYCEGDEITFDGKFYAVRVTARDDEKEIGRGTVGRAVVSVGKFVERMKRG